MVGLRSGGRQRCLVVFDSKSSRLLEMLNPDSEILQSINRLFVEIIGRFLSSKGVGIHANHSD
jgi:hypothetical protein